MPGIRRGAKPEWERASTLAPLVAKQVTAAVATMPTGATQGGQQQQGPHGHIEAEVTNLTADLAGKVAANDPRLTDARTPTTHTHQQSDVTGLPAALAAKSDTSHTHAAPASPYGLASIGANVVRTGTTEGVVLTAQVPGGLAVGSTFRVNAAGTITVVGNPTVRIRVGPAGTIADTQAWVNAAATGVLNTVVGGEWLVTIKTATAVAVEGLLTNSVTNVSRAAGAPATFAVTTASAWFITLGCAMSSVAASLTWTHGLIERRF